MRTTERGQLIHLILAPARMREVSRSENAGHGRLPTARRLFLMKTLFAAAVVVSVFAVERRRAVSLCASTMDRRSAGGAPVATCPTSAAIVPAAAPVNDDDADNGHRLRARPRSVRP